MKQAISKKSNLPFDLEAKWQKILRSIALALAVILLILALALPAYRTWFCLAALVFAGWETVWCAALQLKDHKAGFSLLSTLGVVSALVAGRIYESAWVMLILSLGQWLAAFTERSARSDEEFFDGLLQMRARIKAKTGYDFVSAATLPHGLTVVVNSGERIPADGVVVEGGGTLDYSQWMCRPKTVMIAKDSAAYCGAMYYGQSITLRVTASGKNTLIQRLRAAAEHSAGQKATVQIVLSKVLPWVNRALWILAFITGVFVPLVSAVTFRDGLYAASGILLISAVTRLMDTVSLVFSVGITAMCRRGVLFKSCRQVTLLHRISDIIFSKTGVLTSRELMVQEVVPHNDYDKEQLLYYAAAAEQISDHLIARAIQKQYQDELPTPEHKLEIAGEGVCVVVDGKRIFVGNDELMDRAGIEVLPYHGSGIICFVGVEDTYIGCIILHDPLKNTALDTTKGLFALGLHSIDMVTSDKKRNAENVGTSLGIHRVFAQLRDSEKAELVERSARKGKHGGRIAFVGDESDANCFAPADISFSMSALDGEIRGTAADIAVLSDDPINVLESFTLSYKIRLILITLLTFNLVLKAAMLMFLWMGICPIWLVAVTESAVQLFNIHLAGTCRKI